MVYVTIPWSVTQLLSGEVESGQLKYPKPATNAIQAPLDVVETLGF
jgi:hypothetical protein